MIRRFFPPVITAKRYRDVIHNAAAMHWVWARDYPFPPLAPRPPPPPSLSRYAGDAHGEDNAFYKTIGTLSDGQSLDCEHWKFSADLAGIAASWRMTLHICLLEELMYLLVLGLGNSQRYGNFSLCVSFLKVVVPITWFFGKKSW